MLSVEVEDDPMPVCGVDEAGRGPLAGSVFAAAVILDRRRMIRGLTDSKALSEKKRLALEVEIRETALAFCVSEASVAEIDALNILQASLLAMKRAVDGLQGAVPPTLMVLVDGLYVPKIDFPSRAIVDGDIHVAEISAASILAKNARDRLMCEQALRFPQYGFERHKGYATKLHLKALMAVGPCEIHRWSFAPVREAARRMAMWTAQE